MRAIEPRSVRVSPLMDSRRMMAEGLKKTATGGKVLICRRSLAFEARAAPEASAEGFTQAIAIAERWWRWPRRAAAAIVLSSRSGIRRADSSVGLA
jgi:hypothetical protein